jgi:hypothetical protein
MSATKTRLQKPKPYEARIAKSRTVLKSLLRQRAVDPYIENTTNKK